MRAGPGGCRRLVRRPDRDDGVHPHPASLVRGSARPARSSSQRAPGLATAPWSTAWRASHVA